MIRQIIGRLITIVVDCMSLGYQYGGPSQPPVLLQAQWPGGGSCGPPQTRPAELWSPERESCGGQGMWADLTSQDPWAGKMLQYALLWCVVA